MKLWHWLVVGAAVIGVYLLSNKGDVTVQAQPAAPKLLDFFSGGPGGALNKTAVEAQFRDLSDYASQIKSSVTKNPALGLVLGLSPQQTDYLAMKPLEYQKSYGLVPQPLRPL